jgi:hypothetical protein
MANSPVSQVSSASSFSDHAVSSDFMAGLIEPDIILPEQLLGIGSKGLSGGERKLMAAILSDGVEAYISQISLNSELNKVRSDAVDWVETRDYSYVFSFDMVCQALGIEPEYLRLGLLRYAKVMIESRESGDSKKVWKRIRRPRKQ